MLSALLPPSTLCKSTCICKWAISPYYRSLEWSHRPQALLQRVGRYRMISYCMCLDRRKRRRSKLRSTCWRNTLTTGTSPPTMVPSLKRTLPVWTTSCGWVPWPSVPVEMESGSVSICALNTLPCAYVVFYGPMRKCMINGLEWTLMNWNQSNIVSPTDLLSWRVMGALCWEQLRTL